MPKYIAKATGFFDGTRVPEGGEVTTAEELNPVPSWLELEDAGAKVVKKKRGRPKKGPAVAEDAGEKAVGVNKKVDSSTDVEVI